MIIPKHVAIIMDGNGRWAKEKGKARSFGHLQGTENVRNIAIKANEMGVEVLTLYAFSTENWKRPQKEIDYLMSLPAVFIDKFLKELMEKDIKIATIGDLSPLPKATVDVLNKAITETKNNKSMTLVFALNYGGRADIVNAVNKIIKDKNFKGEVSIEAINENISTSSYPDIDLMIRTSLDYRISNFLLWQLAYSEMYFVDCYWPDFSDVEFEKAIVAFNKRDRKFGGLNA